MVIFLGFQLLENGIKPNLEKKKNIDDFEPRKLNAGYTCTHTHTHTHTHLKKTRNHTSAE